MKKRIASVALLAGVAVGALTTGAQAASQGNVLIPDHGTHMSWSTCQFWASVENGWAGEQQGVTGSYYYCSDAGNGTANLWHRN
ncbi:hypothetical protein [Streptomyces violaceorubidus]|uniref:Lactococcin 972 family bacteriocin n=1 Tax=Streptomyces violaceorubidus TaxID=284042 RepID=A0ABV1T0U5_9ACTN